MMYGVPDQTCSAPLLSQYAKEEGVDDEQHYSNYKRCRETISQVLSFFFLLFFFCQKHVQNFVFISVH